VLTKVPPVYPVDAKKARIQGKVVLNAIIGKDGTVENLTVVSGPNELQQSAQDAVRQWTYKPFLVDGDPVEVKTTINVIYRLAN
jgi:TonB family protein